MADSLKALDPKPLPKKLVLLVYFYQSQGGSGVAGKLRLTRYRHVTSALKFMGSRNAATEIRTFIASHVGMYVWPGLQYADVVGEEISITLIATNPFLDSGDKSL
jgi:hypothetical protein